MPSIIAAEVIQFFDELFGRLFVEPFSKQIKDPFQGREVGQRIGDAANSAARTLDRYFQNCGVSKKDGKATLRILTRLLGSLDTDRIANPNVSPDTLAGEVRSGNLKPEAGAALHLVVQVLLQLGPVLVEWRKLGFAKTYELPRRVIDRLDLIGEQVDKIGAQAGTADERFELSYRDYLMQRFYRVEAGTVKMTTNLSVDLRELFVMPRVRERPAAGEISADALLKCLTLEDARKVYGKVNQNTPETERKGEPAIDRVSAGLRHVLVGLPGSGKSTFLEWLQVKLAAVELEMPSPEGQMIPLLIRIRQIDPKKMPSGAALIRTATSSSDIAQQMPSGWLHRRFRDGRVFVMLDGLDETEPTLRDAHLIPWLANLCDKYPNCRYLVTSRPVGYPPGALQELSFAESELMDFDDTQILEYTRHWCIAVRLAKNELDAEARREGEHEGQKIVDGFKKHPYIRDLARTPLMLSAICLVNYFEQGDLPKDRARLYQLCVEGLLHNWDQRRGIHSEFGLDEKLRACREVAIHMQTLNLAECDLTDVDGAMASVFPEAERRQRLMEQVRYRSGLLIERRHKVFAFSHLTFQEYLAACAIYEGNHLGVDAARLIQECDDGRWREVIALYCGLASVPSAKNMLEGLILADAHRPIADVLSDAFLSARNEIVNDASLRKRVMVRVASAPWAGDFSVGKFPLTEAVDIATQVVGLVDVGGPLSQAWFHLALGADAPWHVLYDRLQMWKTLSPGGLFELVHLLHFKADEQILTNMASMSDMYFAPAPDNSIQAEVALGVLVGRKTSPAVTASIITVLNCMLRAPNVGLNWVRFLQGLREARYDLEVLSLMRAVANKATSADKQHAQLMKWIEEQEAKARAAQPDLV